MTNSRSSVRRRFLLGSVLLALGGLLSFAGSGCEALPEVPINSCGNYVIEPDNFEDCDGDVSDSLFCGPQSTPGACRWLCDYPDGAIHCPPEWGCGFDGICRKPGGLSEESISISGGGTERLFLGDFDGDGRDDIAAAGLNSIDVHYLTLDGFVERTISLPRGELMPAVGDVDADGFSDVVIGYKRSLGTLLGQEGRSFITNSRPVLFASPYAQALIPMGEYTEDNAILAIGKIGDNAVAQALILDIEGGYKSIPLPASALVGTPQGALAVTGTTSGGVKCVRVAFEQTNPSLLVLISRCGTDNPEVKVHPIVKGKPWGGAYVADMEHDGMLDVLFGEVDGVEKLRIVRNVDPNVALVPEDFLSYAAGDCKETSAELASPPLAIGDVNGDSFADIVDSRGVILYDPTQNPPNKFTRKCLSLDKLDPTNPTPTAIKWEVATIGDFNGDGRKDVLAAQANTGVLDLWMWLPTGLVTLPIATGGPLAGMVSGDLDGDGIADAAYWLKLPPMAENITPISVIFGNPQSSPSPPKLVAFAKDVEHISIGRILGWNLAEDLDVASDLAILSSANEPGKEKPITIIRGDTSRSLLVPLPVRQSNPNGVPNTSSEEIKQIAVSEFGIDYCKAQSTNANDYSPYNVITLGGSAIWRAACYPNGASMQLGKDLPLEDNTCLFAPVDATPTTKLAAFIKEKKGTTKSFGLGTLGFDGTTFGELTPRQAIDPNIRLPEPANPFQPYEIADLDGNGQRDVILTARELTMPSPGMDMNLPPHRIRIYLDGTRILGNESDPENQKAWEFTPMHWVWNQQDGVSEWKADDSDISGIAAINIDSDRYKELAIMTRDGVYLVDLAFKDVPNGNTVEAVLDESAPLVWFDERHSPFAELRGGRALLALDANSDGIDDLAVADIGKLLLYLGTEQSK